MFISFNIYQSQDFSTLLLSHLRSCFVKNISLSTSSRFLDFHFQSRKLVTLSISRPILMVSSYRASKSVVAVTRLPRQVANPLNLTYPTNPATLLTWSRFVSSKNQFLLLQTWAGFLIVAGRGIIRTKGLENETFQLDGVITVADIDPLSCCRFTFRSQISRKLELNYYYYYDSRNIWLMEQIKFLFLFILYNNVKEIGKNDSYSLDCW